MEPQQRLMVEVTWDALEDAGIPAESVGGERVAVILGYMAEDLEAIGLTPLVEYNGEGLPDGVNYEKSVLFLNEVIKSQQAQIQALEERLSALEAAQK